MKYQIENKWGGTKDCETMEEVWATFTRMAGIGMSAFVPNFHVLYIGNEGMSIVVKVRPKKEWKLWEWTVHEIQT